MTIVNTIIITLAGLSVSLIISTFIFVVLGIVYKSKILESIGKSILKYSIGMSLITTILCIVKSLSMLIGVING